MYNPDDYISKKKDIIAFFKKIKVTEQKVSEYCSLSSIPLIVVYIFISEEFPEHKEFCDKNIERLKVFYRE